MANRTFYPSQSYGEGRVYAEFRFIPNGAATSIPVTNANVQGCDLVSSITHTAGTNKFVVTLKDTFPALITHSADLLDTSAGTGNYATVGNPLNFGTSTLPSIQVMSWNAAGTALNDPVNTNTFVVTLALKNTNGWGGR